MSQKTCFAILWFVNVMLLAFGAFYSHFQGEFYLGVILTLLLAGSLVGFAKVVSE